MENGVAGVRGRRAGQRRRPRSTSSGQALRRGGGGKLVEGGFADRLIAECLTDEELQGLRAKLRKYAEVVHQRRRAA